MVFDDDFIGAVSDKPVSGILTICDKAFDSMVFSSAPSAGDFDMLLQAAALAESLISTHSLKSSYVLPELDSNDLKNSGKLYTYLKNIQAEFKTKDTQLKLESLKSKYKTALGNGFYYEFSQGDINRIQLLLSELRQSISDSDLFEEDHKSRLLKRLEKLQSELHKQSIRHRSFLGSYWRCRCCAW